MCKTLSIRFLRFSGLVLFFGLSLAVLLPPQSINALSNETENNKADVWITEEDNASLNSCLKDASSVRTVSRFAVSAGYNEGDALYRVYYVGINQFYLDNENPTLGLKLTKDSMGNKYVNAYGSEMCDVSYSSKSGRIYGGMNQSGNIYPKDERWLGSDDVNFLFLENVISKDFEPIYSEETPPNSSGDWGFLQPIFDFFKPVIDFAKGYIDFFWNLFRPIVDFMSGFFRALENFFSPLFEAISNILNNILESIKNLFSWFGNFFSSLLDFFVTLFKLDIDLLKTQFDNFISSLNRKFAFIAQVMSFPISVINTIISANNVSPACHSAVLAEKLSWSLNLCSVPPTLLQIARVLLNITLAFAIYKLFEHIIYTIIDSQDKVGGDT